MGAPKGHPNYNTSDDPIKNGGLFGFLGAHIKYTDEDLKEMGQGVIEWIQEDGNIWIKYYFLKKYMNWQTVVQLMQRSDEFRLCIEMAKSIQESKLLTEPYDKTKNKDAWHARWILARHHKGEWEEKSVVTATQEEQVTHNQTMSHVDYLQSKAKAAE